MHDWSEVKSFSLAIAGTGKTPAVPFLRGQRAEEPGRAHLHRLPAQQPWRQHRRAVLGTRPRGSAGFVPIHRDELADLKGANLWTVRNLLERLQELGDDDPWAAIGKTRQRLTKRFATA